MSVDITQRACLKSENYPKPKPSGFNNVHYLKRPANSLGLQVSINWRAWGIDVSWGDSVAMGLENKNPKVWFVHLRILALCFCYMWLKRPE